jgi:hypothetical protein
VDAFTSENLILLVAATIIINRGFEKTRLRLLRPAYVFVQAFDIVMMSLLSLARLEQLPTKPDFVIRIFLMLFVAYHMVLNSQARGRALRDETEEISDRVRARDNRRERQLRAAAHDAETDSQINADEPSASSSDPELDAV